jgi:hypothetical protein
MDDDFKKLIKMEFTKKSLSLAKRESNESSNFEEMNDE